jgi:hypothetical protein
MKEGIMTSSELAKEVVSIVEAKIRSTHSASEFEMAYQGKLAVERIRFAIKAIEQTESTAVSLEEACLQLLDALDRLESVHRRFQHRFRFGSVRADNDAHEYSRDGVPATVR